MNRMFATVTFVFMMNIFLAFTTACEPTEKYVAWVVGEADENGKAMLLYSADSGKTWHRQAMDILPDNVSLINLHAIDKNSVWAVGESGLVIKTTDGGTTWRRVESNDLGGDMMMSSLSIYQNHIWVSGESGLIMRSTDNGATWTVFDENVIENFEKVQEFIIQGIYVINEDIVYAVGNQASFPNLPGGIVLRTLDGGESWEDIDMPNDYNQNGWIGVKATDPDHVVIYGGRGHYIVTANGGKQWVTGGPLSTRDINDLVMVSSTDYWAACDYDSIIRTTDSGISWEEQPSDGTLNSFLVGFDTLDGNTALIVGQSAGWPHFGKILETTDGGKSWRSIYDCDTNLYKVAIAGK